MCVAVVQVVAKDYSPIANAIGFEPGDVIQVLEDGHDFSPLDLMGRQAVSFPGVPASQMQYLTLSDEQPTALSLLLNVPGMGVNLAMHNRETVKKRRYKIDITNAAILDKTRGNNAV